MQSMTETFMGLVILLNVPFVTQKGINTVSHFEEWGFQVHNGAEST